MPPTRAVLDAVSGDVPVVLVAADLHACWLNTAAARRHGVGDAAGESGVLREDDCFRLVRELDDVADEVLDAWVADAVERAAARGVVGVTDYEMRWNRDDWARRAAGGIRSLRVSFGVYTQHLDRAIAEGLRTGDVVPDTGGLVTVGGYKVITDGSLNTRTAWCFDPYPGLGPDEHPYGLATVAYDDLVPLMRRAHDAGLTPAVHAIGDRANARVLDAFEAVGCTGFDRARAAAPSRRRRPLRGARRRGERAARARDGRPRRRRPVLGRPHRPRVHARGPRRRRAWSSRSGPTRPWRRSIRGSRSRPRSGARATDGSRGIPSRRSRRARRSPPRPAVTARRCGSALRRTSPSSSSTRSRHPSTTCAGCRWRRRCVAGRFTHGAR